MYIAETPETTPNFNGTDRSYWAEQIGVTPCFFARIRKSARTPMEPRR